MRGGPPLQFPRCPGGRPSRPSLLMADATQLISTLVFSERRSGLSVLPNTVPLGHRYPPAVPGGPSPRITQDPEAGVPFLRARPQWFPFLELWIRAAGGGALPRASGSFVLWGTCLLRHGHFPKEMGEWQRDLSGLREELSGLYVAITETLWRSE